jgi:hypothetical protein
VPDPSSLKKGGHIKQRLFISTGGRSDSKPVQNNAALQLSGREGEVPIIDTDACGEGTTSSHVVGQSSLRKALMHQYIRLLKGYERNGGFGSKAAISSAPKTNCDDLYLGRSIDPSVCRADGPCSRF